MNRRLTIAVVVLLAILAPPVLTWMTEPLEVRAARWPAQAVTPTVEDCLILEKRAGLWSARPCEAMPTATPTPTETPTPTLTSTPTVTPSAMTVTPLSPTPTTTVTPIPAPERLCANRNINMRAEPAVTGALKSLWGRGECYALWTVRYDANVAMYPYLWGEVNRPGVGLLWAVIAKVSPVTGEIVERWADAESLVTTPTPEVVQTASFVTPASETYYTRPCQFECDPPVSPALGCYVYSFGAWHPVVYVEYYDAQPAYYEWDADGERRGVSYTAATLAGICPVWNER